MLPLSLLLYSSIALAGTEADAEGWKAQKINDHLPDWVSLTAENRTRYEYLDDAFRAGESGDREILVLRTLINGRVKVAEGLWLGAELEDSRAEVNDDTSLDTSIVNAAELLRAYVEYTHQDVMGGTVTAQGGRITMDVGSRRF
nr:alginate export family protein [Pseudomonadota bacterium]